LVLTSFWIKPDNENLNVDVRASAIDPYEYSETTIHGQQISPLGVRLLIKVKLC